MGYPALDRRLGTTSYFCEPRSPWQMGAVENANGRLRRYLPSDVPASSFYPKGRLPHFLSMLAPGDG